jgi:hypothetical protein
MVEADERHGGWLGRLLRPRAGDQGTRVLAFPPAAAHAASAAAAAAEPAYRGNRTSTTKYTLLSFLPKSLFEQYRRAARRAGYRRPHARPRRGWRCARAGCPLRARGAPPHTPRPTRPASCPAHAPQAHRQHLLHAQRGAVADALQPSQARRPRCRAPSAGAAASGRGRRAPAPHGRRWQTRSRSGSAVRRAHPRPPRPPLRPRAAGRGPPSCRWAWCWASP